MDQLAPQSAPPAARHPWWTAIVCGMASYIDAGAIVSWSIVLVIYQQVYGLTPTQFGLISGLLTFGIAVGALTGGWLGDRFGRRSVFVATMLVVILGLAGMFFAQSFITILISTSAVGLATGADLPVSLSTIGEAANDAQRGTLLGFSQILWLVGIVVAGALGAIVGDMGRLGAQIMLMQLGGVAFLIMLARLTIPESPSWKAAQAERSAGIQTVRADRSSLKELFRAPYAAPFLALLVFYGLENAGFNVGGQYGAYLLVNVAHVDLASSARIAFLALPPGAIGALLFLKTVRGKRRFLYFTLSAIALTLGTLVPAIFGFTLQTYVILLIVSTLASSFAGEALMKFWTQQSFPTLLRTTAQGSVIAVGRFTAAALAFVVPQIIAFDVRVLFLLVAALYGVGCFTAWMVFRTRDTHNEFATEIAADTVDPPAASVTPVPGSASQL